MQITKIFTFESSHRVLGADSERCRKSVHGHSYKVELTLESSKLNRAMMVYDFGNLKGTVKNFIDSFDHCHLIYSKDSAEYKDFFKKMNKRWIEVPFNPTAEMISTFIFAVVNHILIYTIPSNGEGIIKIHSVKVWETATGSATCFEDDDWAWQWDLDDIIYSDGVKEDWCEDLKKIFRNEMVENKPVVD